MYTKMQAAVLYGKEDVRVESVPVPQIRTGEFTPMSEGNPLRSK